MIRIRTYGDSGTSVVVLHGGPGAAGHMAPVARALSARCRVVEPFQRGSGTDGPLTVAQHVKDLRDVVGILIPSGQPYLVGSSWGAMLALAYAAQYDATVGGLVLVGCGTFDAKARANLERRLDERIDVETRAQLDGLEYTIPDPDQRLRVRAELLLPFYCHDPETLDLENEVVDARAHEETWEDMLRQQDAGLYPGAFSSITKPVLMLHGAQDPHPGRWIRDDLVRFIPHLQYREWEACGHYPWLERSVKKEFFSVLQSWLAEKERSPATANVT